MLLTSLFSLFYVTDEFYRFLHRGRAGEGGMLKLRFDWYISQTNQKPKDMFHRYLVTAIVFSILHEGVETC